MAARSRRRPEGARRMTSYQVKFWDIRKISDTARGRYRVRWAVEGREHCKSFATKALADAFLGTLKDAARDGKPFDPVTGLPARPKRAAPATATWYEHACAYAQMKWPDLAAKSRRVGRRGAHHDHPRPDRPAPQRPRPRRRPPGPVRLCVQLRQRRPGRPRADHPGAGLDRAGIPAGRGAGRPSYRPRRPGRVRAAAGRQARRRDHRPPQAGGVRQRARLRRRTAAARRQSPRPDPVESLRGR